MKLVDTTAEQGLLESILEESKPPVPVEAKGYDYLLSTPFRYRSRHPSRFRKATSAFGIFYAAEESQTCLYEMIFYRMLFFAESPDTDFPSGPTQYSVFKVSIAAERAIDLTEVPLNEAASDWLRPADYSACQNLAEAGRAKGLQLIRYQSVREPSGKGKNVALLDPSCFIGSPTPVETWNIFLGPAGAQAIREMPKTSFDCPVEQFLEDPRTAKIVEKFSKKT
ncbi:RES family NAD+ phosphorylase [Paracoccus sp. 11-3]|uniref:RES family NAD+ phosphorylase n=1 Tax=Paracoccus amoyensis TaxID=2760093 RepID=A0A926JBZ3_9RHOB|nr:RES family NAD+ phosphorylase [Paracoccus amoyensis]MBC9246370.1 RES family NAD+ phosphorylase [Paracoccus amoyensis]